MKYLIAFLFPIYLASQTEDINLNTVFFKDKYLKEVIPVINSKDEMTLFFQFRDNASVYSYNKDFSISNASYDFELPKKATNHVASLYNDTSITLIYSNSSGKYFGAITYDRKTNKIETKKAKKWNFKGASVVGYGNDNNKFYLITAIKNSSIIKIYTLDSNLKQESHTIDLSAFEITGDQRWTYSFHNTLFNLDIKDAPQVIEYNIPNSLETTAADRKIFFSKDFKTIYITNDFFKSKTIVCKISTETFKGELRTIEHDDFSKDKSIIRTSSFIIDNYICSLYWVRDYVNLKIRDLNSFKVINEFEIKKDEPITFRNSPIIEKNSASKNVRELKTTNQFLRKTIYNQPTLTIFKTDDIYNLTLGYTLTEDLNPILFVHFGIVGGFLLQSLINYVDTNSVQFTGLFDANFNHVKGEVIENSYDKIETFKKTLKRTKNEFLVKNNDTYYFGNYNKDLQTYSVYSFK